MEAKTANVIGNAKDDGEGGFTYEDGSSKSSLSDDGHDNDDSIQQDAPPPPTTPKIAQNENRAVFISCLLLIFVLTVFTVGVAAAVYHYINRTEINEFEAHIKEASDKVFESIGSTLALSMGAVDMLTVNMVSFAAANNMTWPFVLLPDHAVRLAKLRSLIDCVIVQQYQYVTDDTREEWEKYSFENGVWMPETLEIQRNDPHYHGFQTTNFTYPTYIHFGLEVTPNNTGPYIPSWQTYPKISLGDPIYNWNARQFPSLRTPIDRVIKDKSVVITEVINTEGPGVSKASVDRFNGFITLNTGDAEEAKEPFVRFLYPIVDTASSSVVPDDDSGDVVGILATTFFWKHFLVDILPEKTEGVHVVISNTCGQKFTYEINGAEAVHLGNDDLHEKHFGSLGVSKKITELAASSAAKSPYAARPFTDNFCTYSFAVYPSEKMEKLSRTTDPLVFTILSVFIFLFTSLVFFLYDWLVAVRQEKVMATAVRSSTIVSSLFPSNVRDRLYDEATPRSDSLRGGMLPTKARLKSFLNDGSHTPYDDPADKDPTTVSNRSNILRARPIADLFPETTVLFADIAGFTAWSSQRDPTQVFILLETTYGAFDTLAMRRGVFKVETIGDSYVAVAGLPEPRRDHAVVMARFARDIMAKFCHLTQDLETTLGPGTGDLQIRARMHSGPTTAGVLRGQKSRFQLFGDTVNTASRMESTGVNNRIQISKTTADLLVAANKSNWIRPREETVEVKGKGPMKTFWVEPGRRGTSSFTSSENDEYMLVGLDDKTERLVDWNTDVLGRLISQILKRNRTIEGKRKSGKDHLGKGERRAPSPTLKLQESSERATMVLEEVKEIIELPDFKISSASSQAGDIVNDDELPDQIIMRQLREFVVAIANTYNYLSFHNFMHASHVCMSVTKLLGRIVAPDEVLDTFTANKKNGATGTIDAGLESLESELHDHTYGITSDPLTQFACIFAALIHDVDHPGVPNTQLIKEGNALARIYKEKSIAEQNSVDTAWRIFMEPRYDDLRDAICPTTEEMCRFRSLVVNSVMATDVLDKDLKKLRNERWDKAFSSIETAHVESDRVRRNRKATIVIEHLIQASDVAHTMQHWHVYRKWNERLFEELFHAYSCGRSECNPCDIWYEGELNFFDYYIIPLAKKLSECGVFGVSSDEYLNYALRNREEWERRGKEVIADMVKKNFVDHGKIGHHQPQHQ